MNAVEAIKAMQNGSKVVHRYFTEGEWMCINEKNRYEFEDKATCLPSSFWEFRPDASWQSGWEIFKDIDHVDDSFKEIPAHNSPQKEQAI